MFIFFVVAAALYEDGVTTLFLCVLKGNICNKGSI